MPNAWDNHKYWTRQFEFESEWDVYKFRGSALPNIYQTYTGFWCVNGLQVEIIFLSDDYLRSLLRQLDRDNKRNYFKFPELRNEAIRRRLRWRYKVFWVYLGM